MNTLKNPGTREGDECEKNLVKQFNSGKKDYSTFLNNFSGNIDDIWLTRVTTKQLSKLSNKRVFTRADAYLIISEDKKIEEILNACDWYLDEELLFAKKIEYDFIPYSGISAKMASSEHFQIIKLRPNSFNSLFGCYELGAGASLFCMRDNELFKNSELILGWNTTLEKMNEYYKTIINANVHFNKDKECCVIIKNYASRKIEEMIYQDKTIREKIFNGKGIYEEPYVAWYFTKGKTIERLDIIPFSVTTGSGRSNGEFTIVLKPKG